MEAYTNMELGKKIAEILDAKKAENVQLLNVIELTTLAECFVIASGNSSTQVAALAEEVEEQMTKIGIEPHHVEGGRGNTNWILLDYDGVIVHIFHKDAREFYNLDKLWSDAEKVEFLTNMQKDK